MIIFDKKYFNLCNFSFDVTKEVLEKQFDIYVTILF